jgi:transposase
MTATGSGYRLLNAISLPVFRRRRTGQSKPPYNWHLYKKRHLIENMFAKLKDWRRVATRYDRGTHTFMSAIHIAASFIFYLKE